MPIRGSMHKVVVWWRTEPLPASEYQTCFLHNHLINVSGYLCQFIFEGGLSYIGGHCPVSTLFSIELLR